MAHAATTDLIGSRIGRNPGRFAIRSKLGRGGMGEVFLADDTVLKRPVAMKAVRRDHCQNGNFHQRLLKEAERLSQIKDSHIAHVHDVVEHEGELYVVMEYVEGQTLRTRLQSALSDKEFFSISEQCLSGLDAAHSSGILHCDLKPENVMITPSGQVKILDFGFARRVATDETRDSLELSSSSAVGGTVAYMAPEVLMGKKPDQRSDIFSLGVMLSEAYAGRHPFRSEQDKRTAGRILQAQPKPLPATAPAGLNAVIARMLAKDPAHRYANCAEVLADFRAMRTGQQPAVEVPETRPFPRWFPAAALATLAIAGVSLWPKINTHRPGVPAVTAASRQLVVLPFKPAADDANSRAFASGLTETMAAKLGQIADRYPLEIVPASEVRAQKVNDAQQARANLGATMVLEGSLQQSGSIVRVTYSLVDTRTLRQLHAGVITAEASNPFAVQDRVMDEVLDKLDIELATEDRGRMQSHGTSQPEAYTSYLNGRGYLQEYDRLESVNRAVAAFQHSLQADPGFALAHAGLGQAYLQRGALALTPESVAQAKDACLRAAQLDGSSPDAEICLGMLFNSTGEYEKAAQHLERAVNLEGSRDESYRMLSLAYEKLGRLKDAEALLLRAIAVRPQYWAGYKQLGRFYVTRGRYAEAIQEFKRVVELAPDSFSGYSNLAGVYLHQGDYAAATEALEKSIAIHPAGAALSNLGAAYFYQHKYEDAARNYERAAQILPGSYVIFGNLAEAYSQIDGHEAESRRNYTHALELAERQLRVNPRDGATQLYAALYAAMLGDTARAERYRKSGIRSLSDDPSARLGSALVLAELHKDALAMAELELALKAGLSPTEITNNPAWQRFAAYPRFVSMLQGARKSR